MTRVVHVALFALATLATVTPGRVAAEPEAPPVSNASPSAWSVRLSGELGAGSRALELPVDGVVDRTETGLFPAAGVGFELDYQSSRRLTLGLGARYQSSIHAGVMEQHSDGSEHPLDVRAHRLELALVPRLSLDADDRWTLAAAAGYGVQNFRPVTAHLITPAYSLAGPALRVELQLALLEGALRLRLGPEAQWVVQVGRALRDHGVTASGLALGAEAGVEVSVGGGFALGASYRELRCYVDSAQSQSFEDVSRFAMARLSGAL